MNDLRKAAEMALEALESVYGKGKRCEAAIKELRQALDLQTAIERGTKAWADVPADWVEELRGNDTPQVTPQVITEVPCKTHPDAPHGFDRNASHSADRYVCECEGWEPVDWEAVAADQAMTIAMMKIENKKEYQYEVVAEHADGTYTTRRIPKREWVGLTADEIWKCNKAETGSAVEFHICSAHQNVMDFAKAIEAKLKGKNVPQP